MTVYVGNRFDALVRIPVNGLSLRADLTVPESADGLVIVAYCGAENRRKTSDNLVIGTLQRHLFATVVVDLLSSSESQDYADAFDLGLISERLSIVTDWSVHSALLENLPIGFYVAGTASAAAMAITGGNEEVVKAIVSLDGRVDLAEPFIGKLKVPTLLIVSLANHSLHSVNESVFLRMVCHKELAEMPPASNTFTKPDWSARAAVLSVRWYNRYLKRAGLALPQRINA